MTLASQVPGENRRAAIYIAIRWLMVHTNVPPLRSLYRALYNLAQALTVQVLRRKPAVVAIYARRGMAEGRIQPGISDIDLKLISRQSLAENPEAYRTYRKLARWIPILETNIMCHAEGVLQQEYDRRNILRYAWNDGERSMRLLWGRDALSSLQRTGPPEPAMLYALTLAWQLSTRNFLERDLTRQDPILATSVACRTLGDLCRADHRFLRGQPDLDRMAALRHRAKSASAPHTALLEDLCRSAAAGYRTITPDPGSRSLAFLQEEMRRLLRSLAETPFARAGVEAEITIDAPPAERILPAAARRHLEHLAALMRASCGSAYLGISAAPTLFHKPPNWAAVMHVNLDRLPLSQLAPALQFHLAHSLGLPQPVHLYLLAPEGALSLAHQVHRLRAEPLLLPFVHHDAFHLLAQPESQIDGACTLPAFVPRSTAALRHAVDEALWIATNRSHVPATAEWGRRHPVRDFWWILQLFLLRETLGPGQLHFAVTPAAVERRLAATGRPLPTSLVALQDLDARVLPPEAAGFMEGLLGEQAGEFRLVLDTWRGLPVLSDWLE